MIQRDEKIITEDQYYEIAGSCDKLLHHPEATLEWVAIPWLHVLTEHPVHLSVYQDLFQDPKDGGSFFPSSKIAKRGQSFAYRLALLARNFLRASAYKTWREKDSNVHGFKSNGLFKPNRVDVVIVSWLVHVDHLQNVEDFYFGNLQSMLAERGLSSTLVLRNQSHYPTIKLLTQAMREGPCGRMLLPDAHSFSEEVDLIRRCLEERRRLRRIEQQAKTPLDRRVIKRARSLMVSDGVIGNLRLHSQMSALFRQSKPSMVIVMYEGHAWERCVWHAARTSIPFSVSCAGYQHTILRKHAHAIKRSIGERKLYDPDIVLTLGDVTRRILEQSQDLQGKKFVTYGTHRRPSEFVSPDSPKSVPTFLVLPEGIEEECIYLFNLALDCARRLPDCHFIFRTHPVMPFQGLKKKLRNYEPPPANVEISRSASIDDDFARSGYILYRGSSTVIYGILAGLKPFYVTKATEIDIDPLYALSDWREYVDSAEDLIGKYEAHQSQGSEQSLAEWKRARAFCEGYVHPVRQQAVDELIELA